MSNPCADCVSQGAFAELLMEPGDAPHTFDASSEAYSFIRENLVRHDRHIGGKNAITGTLATQASQITSGGDFIYGWIEMFVTPAWLDDLLPRMLGDLDTGEYIPTGCFNKFGILMRRDYGVFEYTDCIIPWWSIRGEAIRFKETGEPDLLVLRLGIIASTEVGPDDASPTSWPANAPSLGATAAYDPYVFQDTDTGLVLQGTARPVKSFELLVNHNAQPRYRNAVAPTAFCSYGQEAILRCEADWNSTNLDLYNQSEGGAECTLTMSANAMSCAFTIDQLDVPARTPTVPGKFTDIMLQLEGFSNIATASDAFIKATNDSTP